MRKSADEKILVVLADYARGRASVLSNAELDLVNSALKGVKIDTVYITPVVKCAHNKAPTKLMIEYCEHSLRTELETIKPNVVLCLGKGPATVFNLTGKLDHIKSGVFDVTGLSGVKAKLVVTYPMEKVIGDISLRTEFAAAFKKAERFCSTVELKSPENYFLLESPDEFSEYVDKFIRNKDKFIIASDIETNGRYHFDKRAYMRCIAFSWAKGYGICVPFEDDPDGYLPHLERLFKSDVRFIFHNASYDISFMRVVYKIVVNKLEADTMLMAYLLDPTRGKYGYGLKPLSQEHTDLGAYETEVKDEEDDLDEDGKIIRTKWEKAPMLTLSTYCICDCDATLQIYKKFYKQLAGYSMINVSDMLADAVHVICDLQINGVLIDQEFVKETIPKLQSLLAGYEDELTELAGGKYDWNSPKELGKLLYEVLGYKNPYGPNFEAYPTDDEALDRINTPFTAVMRKYRKAFKLCNTYFLGYFSKVEEDGRLRANYWLNSTETGRLSSDEPNLQNLPRKMGKGDVGYDDLADFKVKNAIVAPPGWTIVQADQSQLEMRIAAMVSEDPDLIYSYRNGIDMHSLNAKVCFNIVTDLKDAIHKLETMGLVKDSEKWKIALLKEELQVIKDVNGDKRTAAKSVSFGVLYGMSKWGLKFDLDSKTRSKGKEWSDAECQVMIDRFHSNFKKLSKWLKAMQDFVTKHGYTYTLVGRRRWLPQIKSKVWKEKSGALRMAINTPIQSAGSDIMMMGIVNIRRRIDSTRARLVATVHDSVVMEVRDDYLEEALPIIKDCLENPLFRGERLPFLDIVPLVAEFEIGPKYGSLKEYKFA